MAQKFAAYDATRAIVAFYDSVDSPLPEGQPAQEISVEQWQALLTAQSQGKRLIIDDDGVPVALDPLPPTREQIADSMRAKRDHALKATDWLVARHQDEKLIGNGTTFTAEQLTALLRYRQTLRDISDAAGWPYVSLPIAPDSVT
jgi:hypothetical protein